MKKILLSIAFLGAFALGNLAAQSCSAAAKASCGAGQKSCCMGKMAAAAKNDPSIEARLDPSGRTFYVRKEADVAGTARFVDVNFDEASGKFVNIAPPAKAEGAATNGMTKKEACSASEKKACSAGGEKKACCAAKKEGTEK